MSIYDYMDKNLYSLSQGSGDMSTIQQTQSVGSETYSDTLISGEVDGNISFTGGFIQSYNFVSGTSGWRLSADGSFEGSDGTFRGNLVVGSLWTTIDTTDDIQTAIDTLNAAGGGTLYLKSGTYTITTALTGYSSISIVGISPNETIIDCSSTSANLSFIGTGVYTTGTITSITSGVNVTGSGTSWLANASAGQCIFIGTRWYKIAAVTGDTTLVLAEGYGDNVTMPGAAYRIATIKQDIRITNLTIKNSTGTALVFTDARKLTFDNVLLLSNNKGSVLTNVSECSADRLVVVTSTSNGIELTNSGLNDWESVNCISNGGSGFVFDNVKTMALNACSSTSNTTDGFNITTGVDLTMLMEASGNGGQGIELVATCSDIVLQGVVKSNTSDGIKLTATSDNCKVTICDIQSNGGYGVNIAASTCDNTIITSNTFASNTSGQVNDSGTNTQIKGNVGVSDSASVIFSAATTYVVSNGMNTARNLDTGTYTKIKELQLSSFISGSMRCTWDMHCDGTGTAFSKVYVNDIAVGVEKTTTSATFVSFTDDVSVAQGDKIELYIKNSTPLRDVYIRNFVVTADKQETTVVVLD